MDNWRKSSIRTALTAEQCVESAGRQTRCVTLDARDTLSVDLSMGRLPWWLRKAQLSAQGRGDPSWTRVSFVGL